MPDGGSRWKIPPDSRFFSTNPKAFKFGFMRVLRDTERFEIFDARHHPFSPNENAVTEYVKEFEKQLTRCGLIDSQIDRQPTIHLLSLEKDDLEAALREAKAKDYDLVVLMLKDSSTGIYSTYKTLADRTVGLQSLCLVDKEMTDDRRFAEYITNIMMKVNLKLGGFSHSVESVRSYLARNDIMVLGGKTQAHATP
jgi:eukaryotic translation initiation factor 2C